MCHEFADNYNVFIFHTLIVLVLDVSQFNFSLYLACFRTPILQRSEIHRSIPKHTLLFVFHSLGWRWWEMRGPCFGRWSGGSMLESGVGGSVARGRR